RRESFPITSHGRPVNGTWPEKDKRKGAQMKNPNLTPALTLAGNSQSIIPTSSLKPAPATQNVTELAAKSDAILGNLGRLAASYDHPLTLDGIDGYTSALADLTLAELQ